MTQLPLGRHGLYLPSIKVWNDFFEKMQKTLEEGFKISGSIEDLFLENSDCVCSECGTKLIRIDSGINNGYFYSAMICCPSYKLNNHSKIGWIEMWPDLNVMLDSPNFPLTPLTSDERDANRFMLSDPRIRECFDRPSFIAFELYNLLAREQKKKEMTRPEPAYVHKLFN